MRLCLAMSDIFTDTPFFIDLVALYNVDDSDRIYVAIGGTTLRDIVYTIHNQVFSHLPNCVIVYFVKRPEVSPSPYPFSNSKITSKVQAIGLPGFCGL